MRRLPNRSDHEQGHAQVSQPFRSTRSGEAIHDLPTVRCSIAPNCVNPASYEGYPNDSSTRMPFRLERSFGSECLKRSRNSEGFSVLSRVDSLRGGESPGMTASDGSHAFRFGLDHVVAENSSPDAIDGGKLGVDSRAINEQKSA